MDLLSADTCCKEGTHPNLKDVQGTQIQLVYHIGAQYRIQESRTRLRTKRKTKQSIAIMLGTKYACSFFAKLCSHFYSKAAFLVSLALAVRLRVQEPQGSP